MFYTVSYRRICHRLVVMGITGTLFFELKWSHLFLWFLSELLKNQPSFPRVCELPCKCYKTGSRTHTEFREVRLRAQRGLQLSTRAKRDADIFRYICRYKFNSCAKVGNLPWLMAELEMTEMAYFLTESH